MAYDLLDPNQENEYRKKMIEQGEDSMRVDQFITKQKTRLKSPSSDMDIVNAVASGRIPLTAYTGDKKEKIASQIAQLGLSIGEDQSESQKKELDSMKVLEGSLNVLEKNLKEAGRTGPIIGRVKGAAAKVTEGVLFPEVADYEAMRRSIIPLIARSIGRDVANLSEYEQKNVEEMLPKISDSAQLVKNKIDNIRLFISERRSQFGQGVDVKSTANKYSTNVNGEVAQQGDLMLNRQNNVISQYGEDEPIVLKKSKDKDIQTDNKLINFLANSSFFPIIGGVVGGLAGLPLGIVGSVGTGAAGAMAGAGLKQGLIELLDPNKYDMGIHSQVILTEGLTDALFSGLTFGVMGVGAKGLKLVLQKPGAEVLEAGAKELVETGTKEVAEVGAKQVEKLGLQERILQKQFPASVVPKFEREGYRAVNKESIYKGMANVAEKYVPKVGSDVAMANETKVVLKNLGKQINETLAGKTTEVRPVINSIKELIENSKVEGLVKGKATKIIPKDMIFAIDQLEKEFLPRLELLEQKGIKGTTFLSELQKIKVDLNQYLKGVTELPEAERGIQLLAATRRTIKESIEKVVPEITGTNHNYHVVDILHDAAIRNIDRPTATALSDMVDYMLGGAGIFNPGAWGALAVKKGIQLVSNNRYTQLKIARKLLTIGVSSGNKMAVRNVLRAIQDIGGFTFSIDPGLLQRSIRGVNIVGEAINQLKGNEINPGMPPSIDSMLNLAPQQQGIDPNLQLQGGGTRQGIGMDLGAYSSEGAPLYR